MPSVTYGSTRRAAFVHLLAPLAFAGCITSDDGRVEQLLNQRGFGARYTGDSNEQYYLGIGDQFTTNDDQHPEFNDVFTIRPDGVIDAKNIGEIFVAGLTIPDLEETLTRRYREFNPNAQIEVQLGVSQSKWFYIDGEVNAGGRKPFTGGTTLFDAVFEAAPTLLADEDGVELIRADPYHPLVMEFDYDDMLKGGWSLANAEVRENDIIYVPPNLFGYLTNYATMVFSPVVIFTQAIFSANQLVFSVNTFGNSGRFGGAGGRGGRRIFSYVAPSRPASCALALAPVDPALLGEE